MSQPHSFNINHWNVLIQLECYQETHNRVGSESADKYLDSNLKPDSESNALFQ